MPSRQEESPPPGEEPSPASGVATDRRTTRASDRQARREAPKRSPWHVGSFLRRFLIAVVVGVPVIVLISSSWSEALVWSAVLVVALQALYLVLALIFG